METKGRCGGGVLVWNHSPVCILAPRSGHLGAAREAHAAGQLLRVDAGAVGRGAGPQPRQPEQLWTRGEALPLAFAFGIKRKTQVKDRATCSLFESKTGSLPAALALPHTGQVQSAGWRVSL